MSRFATVAKREHCIDYNTTGAGTSVPWAQHLPRKCLGRKPPPHMKSSLSKENINELKFFHEGVPNVPISHQRNCPAGTERSRTNAPCESRIPLLQRAGPGHLRHVCFTPESSSDGCDVFACRTCCGTTWPSFSLRRLDEYLHL